MNLLYAHSVYDLLLMCSGVMLLTWNMLFTPRNFYLGCIKEHAELSLVTVPPYMLNYFLAQPHSHVSNLKQISNICVWFLFQLLLLLKVEKFISVI